MANMIGVLKMMKTHINGRNDNSNIVLKMDTAH